MGQSAGLDADDVKHQFGLSEAHHLDRFGDDRALIDLHPFAPRTTSRPRSPLEKPQLAPPFRGAGFEAMAES